MHFPAPDQIPEGFRLREPVFQRDYLIHGELFSWNGPFQDFYSPVCLQDQSGKISQVYIGLYPEP